MKKTPEQTRKELSEIVTAGNSAMIKKLKEFYPNEEPNQSDNGNRWLLYGRAINSLFEAHYGASLNATKNINAEVEETLNYENSHSKI